MGYCNNVKKLGTYGLPKSNRMEFTIGDDHFLQDTIDKATNIKYTINRTFWKSLKKKHNSTYSKIGGELDAIIMHYTAGRSAESSAKFLAKPDVKASAHLVIGRAGEIYQLVPFDIASWHAGKSTYGGRSGYNKYSIGIELDNAGPLTKVGSKYQSWFGQNYQEEDVIAAVHRNESKSRYWHTYTEEQLKVTTAIVEAIVQKMGIKHILGHEEISIGRKQDPGPAFPLDTFRKNLLGVGASRNEDDFKSFDGTVVVDKLNIRSGAGASFEKVAKPLTKQQKVEIVDEEDGWYKVQTTVEGWVSKAYVKPK